MNFYHRKTLHICCILAVWAFTVSIAGAAENIDPNDDDSQFAYGENIGWVNFEPNLAEPNVGANVTDDYLTGFVWAENIGWINLDPNDADPNTGIKNDGTGLLTGLAWGENVGWINFSPTVAGDPNRYGVTISGNGTFDGWAYGENIGWIHFQATAPVSYRVRTLWATACQVDYGDLAEFSRQWLLQITGNLVGHWAFDDGLGLIAIDTGSGGNDAMIIGDTEWILADPNRGVCLDLDGNADYVKTVSLTSGLNFAPNSFSVSAWIKPRTVTGGWRTITEYDRAGNNWFGIWLNSTGKFHFRVGTNTKNSLQTLTTNKWYLLTATYDSSTRQMKLYINDQFDSAATQSTGFTSGVASKLTIGTRGTEDDEYFDGKIDDLRVYNVALDTEMIQALFEELKPDLNGSGNVDFLDYAAFAELWLEPCPPGWTLKE